MGCTASRPAAVHPARLAAVIQPEGNGSNGTARPRTLPDTNYTATEKVSRLLNVKLFVLDNSVRETTVAQLKGHTLSDKWKIMESVRNAGLRHQIIGTFGKQRRVDDQFAQMVVRDSRYAGQRLYAFSELFEAAGIDFRQATLDVFDKLIEDIPVGLQRCDEYGISNIILEMDSVVSRDVVEASGYFIRLLSARLQHIRARFGDASRVFLNVRDFVAAHEEPSKSVFQPVVRYLASLPVSKRIAGLLFEDPSGACFPAQLGVYVARTVAWMEEAKWMVAGHLREGEAAALADSGGSTLHFGVHFHNNYGLGEAAVLEALASGADCVWCGIAREGAQTGHANSLTTIVNLQRLGNKDALARYNAALLRTAAIDITQVVTGAPPPPHTELYGARALDICFDASSGMGAAVPDAVGAQGATFDLASLFGIKPTVRISTMCTPVMFADKLTLTFGQPPLSARVRVKILRAAGKAALLVRLLPAKSGAPAERGEQDSDAASLTPAAAADATADLPLLTAGEDGLRQASGIASGMMEEVEVAPSAPSPAGVLQHADTASGHQAPGPAAPPPLAAGTEALEEEEDLYHGFGGWDPAVMRQMWANLNRDLTAGVKQEYDSPEALERLYSRSGGVVFPAMKELLAHRAALLAADTAHPVIRELRLRFTALVGGCSDEELYSSGAAAPNRKQFLALVAHLPDFTPPPPRRGSKSSSAASALFASGSNVPASPVPHSPDPGKELWSPVFLALCSMCEAVDASPAPSAKPASPTLSLDLAMSRIVRVVTEYPQECMSLDMTWGCIARRMLLPVVTAQRRRAMWNRRAKLFTACVRVAAQLSRSQAAERVGNAEKWSESSPAAKLVSRSSRKLLSPHVADARRRASVRNSVHEAIGMMAAGVGKGGGVGR